MSEAKKCLGCGVLLQDDNMLQEGYTTNLENDYCQRCFRMKNYGEYQVITKSNEEYLDILKAVGKTKDLVLYITDLINVEQDLAKIKEYLPNKMMLVLNKRDALPKSVKDEKIIEYFKQLHLPFVDIIVISANRNYHIDYLLHQVKQHQTSKNVYVVGHTNAGKSTLINQLLKNYSENTQELTISPLPSTTLNKVEIILNDHLTLIDTPGLVDRGSLINYVDASILKKLSSKKEMKPKTYQLKKGQAIIIEDFLRMDYIEGEKNSFTLYLSNDLKVKRLLNANNHDDLHHLAKTTIGMKYREDLVICGLGFIKVVDEGTIDLYLNKEVDYYTRKSMI